jgi:hypothetical protein
MIDEEKYQAELRDKMKVAYQLGVEAYRKGHPNPYIDAKLAQLMMGVRIFDGKYLTQEWKNGYKEEELNNK